MTQNHEPQSTWWGQLRLDKGQTVQWQIGPLKLAIQRLPNEWQVTYEQDDSVDPDISEWNKNVLAQGVSELNYANTERYVIGQTDGTLRVSPALADRPIITRPLTPFYVPAENEVTIFVSSPLWGRIEVGDPPIKLQEIPILRPSDTWFGPTTMEGELCCASRTSAHLNFENLPLRPHRAITQVIIRNRASSQLLVERLSLSVPYLSLFGTLDGLLWTQTVTMVRTRDTDMVTFQVGASPPEEVREAVRIGEPRQQPSQNMAVRAFGAIFR